MITHNSLSMVRSYVETKGGAAILFSLYEEVYTDHCRKQFPSLDEDQTESLNDGLVITMTDVEEAAEFFERICRESSENLRDNGMLTFLAAAKRDDEDGTRMIQWETSSDWRPVRVDKAWDSTPVVRKAKVARRR